MAGRALPTGNVTLVFTDIEGSTSLLTMLGERYADLLHSHRRVLRAAFEDHGGVEVGTEGDSFFVAFPSAPQAVAAAVDLQRGLATARWPDDVDVRVRVGVHSGRPAVVAGDYIGLDVHRAARIMSAAHGGQVVVSQATVDLVSGRLPRDVELRDLGDHRLKDLTHPQRLYDLAIGDLQRSFPALRTLENRPTNLPTQATPLVGRDSELAELAALVADPASLVITLTGPGGVGKTRLAMQMAAEQVERFVGGVYFVNLAILDDASAVIPTIAQTLGIPGAHGDTAADQLKSYLGDRRMLVVIDNFEHVLSAAGPLGEIARVAPRVRWVVTSRAALRIGNEREYPVPPLLVPADNRLDSLSQVGSVQLFMQRARAVRPDFELSTANAAAVAAICRDLDGLPLALELAAARLRVLTAEALQDRLDDRLRILTGGLRDAPERQRTLRATIEWSHDLLSDHDRRLLARLAVFEGGWTYDAAEEVCGDDRTDVFDGLSSLVENSLVRHDENATGVSRFSMLETIRSFALERDAGDREVLRDRHAAYFRAVAAEVKLAWLGDTHELVARLQPEIANFRSAIDRFAGLGEFETAAAMTGELGWLLQVAMEYDLADQLTARLLQHRAELTPGSLGKLLLTESASALDRGRARAALDGFVEAVELLIEAGEPAPAAYAAKSAGWVHLAAGDPAAARVWFDRSLDLADPIGAEVVSFEVEFGLAAVASTVGDHDAARTHVDAGLRRAENLAGEYRVFAELNAGEWKVMEGDYDGALVLFEQARDRVLEYDMQRSLPNAQLSLVTAHVLRGDPNAARSLLAEPLASAHDRGGLGDLAWALLLAAGVAATVGDPETAARLLGASDAVRKRGGVGVWPPQQPLIAHVEGSATDDLGEPGYGTAFNRGAALPADDAVGLAMRLLDHR
jgi:predicted ATPase/class 3 adenylate cyclase